MAPNMDPNADVITSTSTPEEQQAKMLSYLASIEGLLKNMASGNQSQSAARDMNNNNTGKGQSQKGTFSQQYDDFWKDAKYKRSDPFKRSGSGSKGLFDSILDPFLDNLEEGLLEGLLGSDYKKRISNVMKDFSDQIGIDLKDIPAQFGKRLGQMGMDAFKQTGLGKKVKSGLGNLKGSAMEYAQSAIPKIREFLGTTARTSGGAKSAAANAVKDVAGTALKSKLAQEGGGQVVSSLASSGAGNALASKAGSGLIKAGAKLGPKGLIIAAAAAIVLKKAFDALGPAIEGTKKMFEELKKAANRYNDIRKKNIEYERKRLEEDIQTLVETPYNILREAAEKVEAVWDSSLRTITATQGYSKADLQNLMAAFAERIRSEGLTSVVSASGVTDNLVKVLESGLAGPVAEEFAYIATKLNAAIPTQDFFGYAGTYASIVANAIRNGQSQVQAVQTANAAIETYASNILYASRQLTGGVTTGLKDAQALFDEAVRIVQASRTGDINQIGGVLTSVSAVVGAIAPDLASAITELVVKAATGGNASQLVALRSLAGVNASNTEFLRMLTTDPQALFVELFKNLSKMQNMAEGAYMEVAEGLADVFGVSMDALARVDFGYLADAISHMQVNTASLSENVDLLASGQTTLTAEQLRTQQINKYLLEEGLSFVLDNEVAREVQKHMWDEQMHRESLEATYAVELKGAALEFLEGLKQTVQGILNILNPFAWIGKLVNLVGTASQEYGLERDLATVLKLGRVGSGAYSQGESIAFYNMMTRGQNLNLTPAMAQLLGSSSWFRNATSNVQLFNDFWNPVLSSGNVELVGAGGGTFANRVSSQYRWKNLRKSTASNLSTLWGLLGTGMLSTEVATTSSQQSGLVERLNKMLDKDVIDTFVKAGKGYDEWASTASQYGIRDLSAALDEAGYTQRQIEAYFEQQQTQQGQEQQQAVKQDEQDFRDKGRDFWISQLERMDTTIESIDVTNSLLTAILDGQTDFYQTRFANWARTWDSFYTKWVNYFVEHTYYNERTGLDYAQIRAEEHAESQGAIYALAEAFNQGVADMSDPTVQTNALLGKILLVCSSIMQQNATKAGGTSLADTLNALALGITV